MSFETNFKSKLAMMGIIPQTPAVSSGDDKTKGAGRQVGGERNAPQIERFDKADFGDLPMVQSAFKSTRQWTDIAALNGSHDNKMVWIRARLHTVRAKGKMAFLVLRRGLGSVQCLAADDGSADAVSRELVKYASKINSESIVDVFGRVAKVDKLIDSCTQSDVEIKVKKLYVVNLARPELPFQLDDASRPEPKDGEEKKEGDIYVGQELRLDNRVLDLRTQANHAIMRVTSAVGRYFRQYFLDMGFCEIHSPKLQGGVSEGGSEVFRLKYFGRDACLAQSPQLYKQMAVEADLFNVFEIGPVFRAENSNTNRHMCEFTGMDFEMEVKEHYHEVLRMLSNGFVYIFDNLNKHNQAELEAVRKQYPFKDLRYRPRDQTLVVNFIEGIRLLKEAGYDADPLGDLSTPHEKALGRIIAEKYGTDFYFLDNYPAAARPFYTMISPIDSRYTCSYDVFLRTEEITSGAQRIHDVEMIKKRATDKGIPLETLASYLDSFSMGAYPHGGGGVGLDRVVMLFLGLDNIRKSAMFPRTPNRLAP